MRKMIGILMCVVLVAAFALAGCASGKGIPNTAVEGAVETQAAQPAAGDAPEIPEIPQVEVAFGHEPYLDHTQMSVAVGQDWTKEVGITLAPDGIGRNVAGENVIPVFASGDVDVMSGSVALFLGAADQIPDFKLFVNCDIFQGYGLMAQLDAGYKSVQEFIDEGMGEKEAMTAACAQMQGKTFAYPAETAIKGFVELVVTQSGLGENDFETIIAEDSKTSAMMISKQADFQVGGVPSRLTLMQNNFKTIITAGDFAKYAEATPKSDALRGIFYDGWLATDEYIENNYDTILRMTGISYRINQFIQDHPEEALAYHLPFVNSLAGTNLTTEDGLLTYSDLDPFWTFEQTATIYADPSTEPLAEVNATGSQIQMWIDDGVYKEGEVSLDDFSIGERVYNDMVNDKASAEENILKAKELIGPADCPQAISLLEDAEYHLSIFNFLDASRFAEAAVQWAEYELK